MTTRPDYRTPKQCVADLIRYLPPDLSKPYVEKCLRNGRVETIGLRFDPAFPSEQRPHEPLPNKFWIDCSDFDIDDLFDDGTAHVPISTADEEDLFSNAGQFDENCTMYTDVRLNWASIAEIVKREKRPIEAIRQSIKEPTQTTMKGRPVMINWDDWWLAVVELALSGRLSPESTSAQILRRIDISLRNRNFETFDRKRVEDKLTKIRHLVKAQLPPLAGE